MSEIARVNHNRRVFVKFSDIIILQKYCSSRFRNAIDIAISYDLRDIIPNETISDVFIEQVIELESGLVARTDSVILVAILCSAGLAKSFAAQVTKGPSGLYAAHNTRTLLVAYLTNTHETTCLHRIKSTKKLRKKFQQVDRARSHPLKISDLYMTGIDDQLLEETRDFCQELRLIRWSYRESDENLKIAALLNLIASFLKDARVRYSLTQF